MSEDHERTATYRDVFAVPEFRFLWVADVLSLVGDQLARVALSVLVFSRTGSPLMTATVYALSFLPPLVGGPVLAGLADRYPRRGVMVASDLARAVLVALMTLPHLPFAALCALLFATELLASPFGAARAATVPEVLPDDRYVLGSAVTSVTNQLAQVVGFAVGGAAVAALGTRSALGVDAVTFLLSAVILRAGVRARPAATSAGADAVDATMGDTTRGDTSRGDATMGDTSRGEVAAPRRTPLLAGALAGARLLAGEPRLRVLVALSWLCAFYVVPEALAAPYVTALGGGAVAVGLMLAANPAGTVVGAVLVSRFVAPTRRLRLMGPLAILACLPLLGFLAHPGLTWTCVLLALSGLGSAYNLPANAAFVAAVPPRRRGQAFGLVNSGILVAQGLALFLAGVAAEHMSPHRVIVAAGACGLALAVALAATVLRPGRPVTRALAVAPLQHVDA